MVILLKIVIHLLAGGTFAYLFLLIDSGAFGGDPVKDIIHFTGKTAINLLIATLLVTPVVKFTKYGQLNRVRRLLGIYCFVWASSHFATFAFLDLGLDLSLLSTELVKRPYLVLGFSSWLILLAMAITSTQAMMLRLKRRWKQLHQLVYLVAILIPIHYLWSTKSEWIEPSIYIAIFVGLLIVRHQQIAKIINQLNSKVVA
ncbi:MAG: sulfoxide reductase heme-binding subunit YedZ [Gammaproteobacteria bacterium]|nr:sulfoxide reductase heme-binding subunit YedZ [Gammaproteobacteria bacterium]